jgi:hemoglobin/transferrin/lactoferrin receptor protein
MPARPLSVAIALVLALPPMVLADTPPDAAAAPDTSATPSAKAIRASATAPAFELSQIVVVAARRPQPTEDVVGTVSVIARPEIERLQAQDIRDLVRYEPGVTVTGDGARFGLDGFNIRGMQGNRIQVRIDGVPMPDGFSVGSFSNAGRDQIDPELVERLEILRGPASALYGSDALGGIVTLTSRDARDLLPEPGQAMALRTGFSTRDEAWRVGALGAWRGEDHGLLVSLVERRGHEVENQATGTEPRANPANTRRSSALLRWSGRYDDMVLTGTVDSLDQRAETDVRSLVNGPGQFSTTERLEADDTETRERVLATVSFEQPVAWLDELELRAYWQGSRTRQDTLQQRRAAPPALRFPTLRERRFDFAQWQQGVQAIGRASGTSLGAAQDWVFGAEFQRTRVKSRRDGLETNLASGATTHVILGEVLPVRDFPNSVLGTTALFAAGELRLGESAWSLLPALRWDYFRVDARVDPLFLEDNPRNTVVDTSDSRVTPKLGLRVDVDDDDRLYLAWAEGFRAPPFSDVNIALALPQFNYVVRPNPDLQPERSQGLELGWNREGRRAAWRIAVFDNRYRNLIESRANLGPDASGALVFQSVNRARVRIRGIEGAARIGLAELAPTLESWSLLGAVSIARGDDTARDVPLNTVQPDRLVLGLERAAVDDWPEFALVATAVRRVSRVDRSSADLFAPPGYLTLDLTLRKRFGESVTLDAALRNLGDVRYWDWANLRGVLVRNVPPPGFHTAPGRNAALTLTVEW